MLKSKALIHTKLSAVMNFSDAFVLIVITCVLLFMVWHYALKPYVKLRLFHRWLAKNPRYKKMHEIEVFLSTLYHDADTHRIAMDAANRMHTMRDDYIYGEINVFAFLKILAIVQPKPGELFYDLGSGAGKAVFAAALYGDFAKLYGIELLPELKTLAQEKMKQASVRDGINPAWQSKLARIQFINQNFLDTDFSDGNIIFINATCFVYQSWQALIQKLLRLKPGSRVIVHTKKIEDPAFTLIHASRELASWGDCAVHIYERTG